MDKSKKPRRNKKNLSREHKRDRFATQGEKKSTGVPPVVLVVGILALIAVVGGAAFAFSRPSAVVADVPSGVVVAEPADSAKEGEAQPVTAATSGHDPYPLVAAEDGSMRLPLSTFDDGKAHYYTYMNGGQSIEFFVLKSQDGVVRAAFNACDVCFQSKRGYNQDGDEMVCNNCGQRFPSDQINVLKGGCNPSPLQRSVDGDYLVLLETDIVAGQGYF